MSCNCLHEVARCVLPSLSLDALLVVLELHDERLDVLALGLPVLDALLRVRVEVLLLLVEQGLRLQGVDLLLAELADRVLVPDVRLVLLESLELSGPLSLLLALLLFSKLQFLVALLPELGILDFLLPLGLTLGLLALDLKLSAPLDGSLHLGLTGLLLLIQAISPIFSLSNLSVKHFFLVVSKGPQFLDLSVDHLLPGLLLISEALLFALFLQVIKLLALKGKLSDLLLLL